MKYRKATICIAILCIVGIQGCATLDRKFAKEIDTHRKEKEIEWKKDQRFPLKSEIDYNNVSYFKPDYKYKVHCSFIKSEKSEAIDIPTYSGKVKGYMVYGYVHCPIEKDTVRLALYRSLANLQIYKNHLFLPFKDMTNNESTYGGGRYIDIFIDQIKDNQLVIDFNKCYNPWCAYSDGFNCPIPPKENHLAILINAGEKNYKGEHKIIENH